MLHFALKAVTFRVHVTSCLGQKLLHFRLMLHFASIVTFYGVTRSVISFESHVLLFTTTIAKLLRFLEYFHEKIISMKNFPLRFVKVRSTHLSFRFLHKCGKI